MKYNFVIFASDFYCYETAYGDIIGLENTKFIINPTPIGKSINYPLYRIHHSVKINNIINIPYKNIWFKSYFKDNFREKLPLCFVFFSNWLTLERYGYIDFLRRKYKNSKYVCFFQDMIILKKDVDIEHVKKTFDLVISFDHYEATQYKIKYFPLVNSRSRFDLSSDLQQSDIFFLGAAKNRLNDIYSAYEQLKYKNLKCDFYLTGVKLEDQQYKNEIHFIKSMPYIENLKHIFKTNCILEIMQKGGHGFTQRMVEAITYDKKIITNNPEVLNSPFYDSSNILVFESINDISENNLFFHNFSRKADHHYKNEISPLKLLDFITDHLKIN